MEIKQSEAAGRAGRLLARRKGRSHGTLRVVTPDIWRGKSSRSAPQSGELPHPATPRIAAAAGRDIAKTAGVAGGLHKPYNGKKQPLKSVISEAVLVRVVRLERTVSWSQTY